MCPTLNFSIKMATVLCFVQKSSPVTIMNSQILKRRRLLYGAPLILLEVGLWLRYGALPERKVPQKNYVRVRLGGGPRQKIENDATLLKRSYLVHTSDEKQTSGAGSPYEKIIVCRCHGKTTPTKHSSERNTFFKKRFSFINTRY